MSNGFMIFLNVNALETIIPVAMIFGMFPMVLALGLTYKHKWYTRVLAVIIVIIISTFIGVIAHLSI